MAINLVSWMIARRQKQCFDSDEPKTCTITEKQKLTCFNIYTFFTDISKSKNK